MSNTTNSPAISRIEQLLDEKSFVELGSMVTARSTDFNLNEQKAASDGVVIGHGLIDGNLVFVYSQDASVLNGTIGEMHAKKINQVYDLAVKVGAPVIGLIDCAGIRLQESFDALDAVGSLYKASASASGVVPQVLGIFGNCGGGLSVLAALADYVVMEKDAKLFVNSPDTIDGNYTDKLNTATAEYQFTTAGTVDFVGSEGETLSQIRSLIAMLPSNSLESGLKEDALDDLNRACDLSASYEAADSIRSLSDNGVFVETKAGYACDMVTGLMKLGGTTVGVIANAKDSKLTAEGTAKAKDFISFCDAFELPILSLTNVSGYEPSFSTEISLAKAAASMVSAFASATVPKINLIIGDAVGTAGLLMNSKSVGADLVLALSDANVGIMDPAAAAKIMYAEDPDVISEKSAEFAQLQSGVNAAAARGLVDRIVNAADARKYLIAGFEMLYSKSDIAYKKHSTK